ncbi:hypothetical protein IE00_18015 [Paracoccus sp. SM22M-07]|nr:hypothetical protein IE00_18015 [Paracoccus sp. SM22M-07]
MLPMASDFGSMRPPDRYGQLDDAFMPGWANQRTTVMRMNATLSLPRADHRPLCAHPTRGA